MGHLLICGVDEAGRGPLAGPVVAAAALFEGDPEIDGLADSKTLSAASRLRLAPVISDRAVSFAIVCVAHNVIDKINILQASLLAMKKAIECLTKNPDMIFIDGNHEIPGLAIKQRAVVDGDKIIPHISAASILAKVARDILMIKQAELYPEYEFEKHKGYPTRRHLEILKKIGPCPIHRFSFRPISSPEGLIG